ncbi:unnamed protein product, partial [Mesorhabditis belari]|uniref:receptor protein-tyrosine kinase n=1 Tax=Mesorhabditis belari TaxID=2138241 RepID=A0AAF3JAC3_9BILA
MNWNLILFFAIFIFSRAQSSTKNPFANCKNVTTNHSPNLCYRWHLYVFAMLTPNGFEKFEEMIKTLSGPCAEFEGNMTESERGKITYLVPYDNATYEQFFGDDMNPEIPAKFLDDHRRNYSNTFFADEIMGKMKKNETDIARALYLITDQDCKNGLLNEFADLDIKTLSDAIVLYQVPVRQILVNYRTIVIIFTLERPILLSLSCDFKTNPKIELITDAFYDSCGVTLIYQRTKGLFDVSFGTDLCFVRENGLCSGNPACLPAPPETKTKKPKSSNAGAWGYIAGAIGGVVLFMLFCLGLRFGSLHFCPQWTLKKMRSDIWKIRDYLPEEERAELDAMKVAATTARNDYMNHVVHRTLSGDGRVRDKWEIEQSSLVLTSIKLGSGAYAVVYKGLLKDPSPFEKMHSHSKTQSLTKVAVKMCHPHATREDKIEMIREIDFMIGLENGLSKSDLLPIAWQISDALLYLSGKKIIHRDVAVRNVLITGQNLAKLADFGLCRESNSLFYTSRGGRLPIKWMAPESLKTAEFTEKTDVWSFGVLLWELYTFGNSPFVSIDAEDVFEHIKKGNRLEMPEDSPELIKALSFQCWAFDPIDRPNFEKIRSLLYKSLEIEASDGYLDFRRNRIDDTVSITSEQGEKIEMDEMDDNEVLQGQAQTEISRYESERRVLKTVAIVTIEQENEAELKDEERNGEVAEEMDEEMDEEIFEASDLRVQGIVSIKIEERDKNGEAKESIQQVIRLRDEENDEETQKELSETPIYS